MYSVSLVFAAAVAKGGGGGGKTEDKASPSALDLRVGRITGVKKAWFPSFIQSVAVVYCTKYYICVKKLIFLLYPHTRPKLTNN